MITNTHKKFILATLSAIAVLVFVTNCSPEDEDLTEVDQESLTSETKPDGEAIIKSDNGLLMQLGMEDAEKRLVKITWKNIVDTDLVVTLSGSIIWRKEDVLIWPWFHFDHRRVGSQYPTAIFFGRVSYGDVMLDLDEVLRINDLPLYKTDMPVEKIERVKLEPGEEISAIFDFGTLFDGIPDGNVDKVSVHFTYACNGLDTLGEKYWLGSLTSNTLEIKR